MKKCIIRKYNLRKSNEKERSTELSPGENENHNLI